MTKPKKILLLKDMRRTLKRYSFAGLCSLYDFCASGFVSTARLKQLGLTRPRKSFDRNSAYWFPPYIKAPRIKLINQAIARLSK